MTMLIFVRLTFPNKTVFPRLLILSCQLYNHKKFLEEEMFFQVFTSIVVIEIQIPTASRTGKITPKEMFIFARN